MPLDLKAFKNLVVVLTLTFALFTISSCKYENGTTAIDTNERKILNDTEKSIYRSADSMLAAFNRKDWLSFVKFNHPTMVNRMGGPGAFASFINRQVKQLPDSAKYSVQVGKLLQVVETTKDVQCLLEQLTTIQLPDTILHKTTYLAGESLDDGNHWTFFDVSTKSGLSPTDIKPDLSEKLQIPKS